jgi:hypothetical protein
LATAAGGDKADGGGPPSAIRIMEVGTSALEIFQKFRGKRRAPGIL